MSLKEDEIIHINPVELSKEMQSSYLDYAVSVIVSRAVPDARDGLKPVQRRILFAMRKSGYDWSKPYKKSAGTVGDTLKNYHPHGNTPVYEAMVRMAQPFSFKIPLIDGQGNFGSLDGDPPAAERYTEARLAKAAKYILHEKDMDAVPYENNYDNSTTMPSVLPARFPNLLVNGANGIAVGMATTIPPHNINETLDACIALLDNDQLSIPELMQYIPAPDFPLGGEISNRSGILNAYTTGRGAFTLSGQYEIEEKNDRETIIITTIPYQINKARLIEQIADLVKEGEIDDISEIRDESNEDGIRIVIDLKRNANSGVIINKLLSKTQLQINIHMNMLAIVNKQPMQMNLKQILMSFLDFREDVIVQRTKKLLSDAQYQAHKLWGLALALGNIDAIIDCIKKSPDPASAEKALQEMKWDMAIAKPFLILLHENYEINAEYYHFTAEQAKAILDLKLHRLTRLEFDKLSDEVKELARLIAEYNDILYKRDIRIALMKQEFEEVKKDIGVPRATIITDRNINLNNEDFIEDDLMVVMLSLSGYIKRMNIDNYRTQKRGGKGKSGTQLHEDDISRLMLTGTNKSQLLFFSNLGKVYSQKIYQLPEASNVSKGKAIVNILPINYEQDEAINSLMCIPSNIDTENMGIVFITASGKIRRNDISSFSNVQTNGKRAMSEDEILVNALLISSEEHLLLTTAHGKAIRFAVNDLRVMKSRDSAGVIGIDLKRDDKVVSALNVGNIDAAILTISVNGYGKRTAVSEYRCAKRGGLGVATMDVTKKTGDVLKALCVLPDDEIILLTKKGQLIRCLVSDIRIAGRDTQGVMLVKLDDDDLLVNAAIVSE